MQMLGITDGFASVLNEYKIKMQGFPHFAVPKSAKKTKTADKTKGTPAPEKAKKRPDQDTPGNFIFKTDS